MEKRFWYRNWWLYYLLFFLLLGVLIYAFLWQPHCRASYSQEIPHQEIPAPETPDPPQAPQPSAPEVVECNATVESGGQGRTVTRHALGSKAGRVVVEYEMYQRPDKLTVIYNGKVVATTGDVVSGYGSIGWDYPAQAESPQECEVEVYAPEEDTKWDYQLNCPQ